MSNNILWEAISLRKFSRSLLLQLLLFSLCNCLSISVFSQAFSKISTSKYYVSEAEKGLNTLYNWQFNEADKIARYFIREHPTHPTGYFLQAIILYWQNYPFNDTSKVYNTHMALLDKSYQLADEISENTSAKNEDAILFKLMAKSAKIRNYDNYGNTLKAVGHAREVYKLMMDCMEMKEQYVEFYFPSGLYNYYREYYPEAHPIYKPFMFFFKSGDKALGLKEMELAIEKAVFTYPEALGYLSYIYFYIEKEEEKGLQLYKKLYESFPSNKFFLLNYMEALTALKDFEKLQDIVDNTDWKNLNSYYKMGFETFKGLTLQKAKGDQEGAKRAYEKALFYDMSTNDFGKKFYFYIYNGLADYWYDRGNEKYALIYRKKSAKYKPGND